MKRFKPMMLIGCLALILGVSATGKDLAENQTYCQVAGDACLWFDGQNDWVDLGNDSSLQMSGNLTVSAWVKLGETNDQKWLGIAGKINLDNRRGYGLGRYSTNHFIFLRGDGSQVWATYSAQDYADTEWHHVAGVHNGVLGSIYVDGQLEHSDSHTYHDSGHRAFIGRTYDSISQWFFDGHIDDVRFYARALSSLEINEAMGTLPAGNDPALVGYWNLDEGAGTLAQDRSLYANHGLLKSNSGSDPAGPQWVDTQRFCGGAAVDTYYVDAVHGNDQNNGHTAMTAFRSLWRGIQAAGAGDTVRVLPGVYVGTLNRDLDFAGRLITLRSEDGPASVTLDCQHRGRAFWFHHGEDASAVVEGFTVLNGFSNQGGAIFCDASGPTIRDCRIIGCASPIGGAIYCRNHSSAVITHCEIRENSETGGVRLDNSSAQLRHCVIADNTTTLGAGGGIRCDNGYQQPLIENCTVAGNTSGSTGGGLWCRYTNVTVRNSIFYGNHAVTAGHQMSVLSGSLHVSTTNVEGGKSGINNGGTLTWGPGNVDVVPRFADVTGGDYHLMSERGRHLSEFGVWVTDRVTSACIDAGNPADPVGQEPAPNGGRRNLGAYGGTAEASLSPDEGACFEMDFNGDGEITLADLYDMIDAWLTEWEQIQALMSKS